MPVGAIPFPFGICRICKDKATGVHYGVATCEGCKGFFKRSITRGDKYKCFFGGECDLNPKNRNRCKSCRFKRCMETGMSVEAVRMGRIPKVEKEKALEVFHQEGSDFNKLELKIEQTGTGSYDFQLNPKENDELEHRGYQEGHHNTTGHHDVAGHLEIYHNAAGHQEMHHNSAGHLEAQHDTAGHHDAAGHVEGHRDAAGHHDAAGHVERHRDAAGLQGLHHNTTGPDTAGLLDMHFNTAGHVERQHDTAGHLERQHNTAGHVERQHDTAGHLERHHDTAGHVERQHNTAGHVKRQHLERHHNTAGHVERQHDTDGHLQRHHDTDGHVERQHDTVGHLQRHHNTDGHVERQHLERHHNAAGHLEMHNNRAGQIERHHDTAGHLEKHCNTAYHGQSQMATSTCNEKSSPKCENQEILSMFENIPRSNLKQSTNSGFPDQASGLTGSVHNRFGFNFQRSSGQYHSQVSGQGHRARQGQIANNVQSHMTGGRQQGHMSSQLQGQMSQQGRIPDHNHALNDVKVCIESQRSSQGHKPNVSSLQMPSGNISTSSQNKLEKQSLGMDDFERYHLTTQSAHVMTSGSSIHTVSESFEPDYSPDRHTNAQHFQRSQIQPSDLNHNGRSMATNVSALSQYDGSKPMFVPENQVFQTGNPMFDDYCKKKRTNFHQSYAPEIENEPYFQQNRNPVFRSQNSPSERYTNNSENPYTQNIQNSQETWMECKPNIDTNIWQQNRPLANTASPEKQFIQSRTQPVELSTLNTLQTRTQYSGLSSPVKHSYMQPPCPSEPNFPDIRCCPTPSSTTSRDSSSSNQSRYNPVLIKVLLEQVLESNQGNDITMKLKQKLEDSKVNTQAAQKLLELVHKVSSSKQQISHDRTSHNRTSLGSSGCSSDFAALPEGKSASLASFLQDVSDNATSSKSRCSSVLCSDGRTERHSHKRTLSETGMLTSFEKSSDSERSSQANLSDKTLLSMEIQETDDFCLSGMVKTTNVTSLQDEEVNTQEMKALLEGLGLGMKILFRLKPEHREKRKLYLQGKLSLRVLTDSEEDIKLIYDKLISGIPDLNQRVLGFCDSVPGFLDVMKDDREKLMKRSYYDMWTLSYAEYFQGGNSYWILPTGEIYSAKAMRKILNDEMVDIIMQFADEFNPLKLLDVEVAVLCAVRLTATEDVVISDKPAVKKLHSQLLDLLAYVLKKNHPNNHSRLLINIFKLMPLIESINRIQKEIIGKFSTKFDKGKLKEAKGSDNTATDVCDSSLITSTEDFDDI